MLFGCDSERQGVDRLRWLADFHGPDEKRSTTPSLGDSPSREAEDEDLVYRVSIDPLVGRHLAPQRLPGERLVDRCG
jgi:hypothetical protein